jgi:DNA-binding transcriptional LysR family regulator
MGEAFMNWDDLRFFLALAREGTVSGAGRALEVKHTTVARRVAAFEE